MRIQKLNKGRASILERKGKLKISIPIKRIWILIIVYATAEIIIAGFINGFIETELKKSSDILSFPVRSQIILAIIVFFFIVVFITILSLIFRREIIIFQNNELQIKKRFTFYRKQKFQISDIKDLYIQESLKYKPLVGFGNSKTKNWIWTIVVCEVFNFIYQDKKIRFGKGIDEAEAKYILQLLVDKGYININQTIANK